jgi:lysozyme
MMAIKIFFKKLFGLPLTDLERLYLHPGPVIVLTPKPPQAPVTPPPSPVQPEPSPIPPPSGKENVFGIDTAHWQKGIRWADVAKEGVRFAIHKAVDGATGVDDMLAIHPPQAKAVGIRSGYYCFNRFKADPIQQAKHFVAAVGGGLKPGELCLALDVEWDNSSGAYTKYRDGGEMDDGAAEHVLACLVEIERLTGTIPWIYTAPGFWTGKFRSPERFSRYPLWLNDFTAKSPNNLRVPRMSWKAPTVWQYGEKPMAGVGGVDLNLFLGGEVELMKLVKQ